MAQKISFICNNELHLLETNPAITVLDILRSNLRLTGTKEGCREGDCGACTILVGTLHDTQIIYQTSNSCLLPVGAINGKHIVTIEGLKTNGLNLLQHVMVEQGGTQCGFCTPGFIMSMTGYFLNDPEPTVEKAIASLDGNICRCTGYAGIRRAIAEAITEYKGFTVQNIVDRLVAADIIPAYFTEIPAQLAALPPSRLRQEAGGAGNFVIGGGTDLFVQKWDSIAESSITLLASEKPAPDIIASDEFISIPGTATINAIMTSAVLNETFPKLSSFLGLFGSKQIRNRATAAGNIVNASPIADFVNILIALGTDIILSGDRRNERIVPLFEFYKGYKSFDLLPGEIITEIRVPKPKGICLINYEKISKRTHLDIASVNTTCYFEIEGGVVSKARISAGGVGPIPLLLKGTSENLIGKSVNAQTISETVDGARSEISPISDARGSAKYKSLLLGQLIKSHFLTLFPDSITVEDIL